MNTNSLRIMTKSASAIPIPIEIIEPKITQVFDVVVSMVEIPPPFCPMCGKFITKNECGDTRFKWLGCQLVGANTIEWYLNRRIACPHNLAYLSGSHTNRQRDRTKTSDVGNHGKVCYLEFIFECLCFLLVHNTMWWNEFVIKDVKQESLCSVNGHKYTVLLPDIFQCLDK